jgi:hypothetical protein
VGARGALAALRSACARIEAPRMTTNTNTLSAIMMIFVFIADSIAVSFAGYILHRMHARYVDGNARAARKNTIRILTSGEVRSRRHDCRKTKAATVLADACELNDRESGFL